MTEQFLGCTISIEVGGGLGFYQGIVKSVNISEQLVTLVKVLHNGKPNHTTEVIISAADILDLKILHCKEEKKDNDLNKQINDSLAICRQVCTSKSLQNESTKNANISDSSDIHNIKYATYLDLIQCQPIRVAKDVDTSNLKESTENFGFKPVKLLAKDGETKNDPPTSCHFTAKSKPRTSVGETLAYGMFNNTNHRSGLNCLPEYGFQRQSFDVPKTPNKRLQRKNYRDETTFGTPIDEDVFSTEFDFEKNLALFDKQAVMEEIQSLKPDVIKQADRNSERQFRYDKNVITAKPSHNRQIIVPAADAGDIIYATDNGLLVPSVTSELRMNLLSAANQHGLTKSRQLEMIGRATTEIILSVIGGSHRLEPGNSHQTPMVVIMCGANMQGAAGVNCGRQLESHGVQTVVITPSLLSSQAPSLLLSQETQLYSLTTGRITTDTNCLPSTVDLIIDARYDLDGNVATDIETSSWILTLNAWALSSRAPVVALDPPTTINIPLTPRILLSPALPLAYLPEKGKVYLLNLNIPQQVFLSLDIKYTPPYGSKMVIPLHPCE